MITLAWWTFVYGPAIATALYLAGLAIDSWAGAYIERRVEDALNGEGWL